MKRIVVIGGTSTIAEHCARLWSRKQPIDLTLVGRDVQRLERAANDLRVRSPLSEIRVIKAGFLDTKSITATVNEILEFGRVDIVLIAHGSLPQQTVCQNELQSCRDALEINGISPALYAEAFGKEMEVANHGTIALIGSVAGDRGRKTNYVYGAAKGLLTRYSEGLQHRFAGTGVKIVLIKPGPTNTPMTAHLKNKGGKLASVEDVAALIVEGIEKGKAVIYAPSKWWLVMMIVRHIPSSIFNKLNI